MVRIVKSLSLKYKIIIFIINIMSLLLHGDCLEHLKGIDDESVDLIFCDLPYGQTSCKWDCKINLEKFWIEVMRIKKLRTPIFMTTTTKFGVELISTAPKKCPFRYDLVWVKSAPAGFLSAKKMPMRKHEMVYVFYEKLPLYDLSSHTHKFLKEEIIEPNEEYDKRDKKVRNTIKKEENYGKGYLDKKINFRKYDPTLGGNGAPSHIYDPPLPVSVVKEELDEKYKNKGGLYSNVSRNGLLKAEPHYDPPLPVSVVKEDVYDAKERFKNGKLTKHPRHLQKGDDPIYDPPLPVSVIKGENNTYNTEGRKKPITREPPNKYDPPLPVSVVKENKHTLYGEIEEKGIPHTTTYDPPLPTTMLEIKSTRGKHSTEKPVALMEWILKYFSKEGDVVLDPTMGSGSTGVACKNMNRNFIGIELDPDIYEVAVNRIND
jgi:hypothetical protein